MLMLVEISQQPVSEARQIQEIMLGLANDEAILRMIFAARVDQLGRIKQVAAVIALVSAGVGIAAQIALPLHVAVGQEAALHLAVEKLLRLFIETAPFFEQQKDILRDAMMVLRIGVREQVVADADLLLSEQEALMVMFEDGAGGHAAPVSLD
jgi:hypothetical protein